MEKAPFKMAFDIGTIKHLGLQMYSTLPPVIGELVSNGWDADATEVKVTIPTDPITDASEIIVADDGGGMSDADIRNSYLVIGQDRRVIEGRDLTDRKRLIQGRKGIGKLSAFGIAGEIEIESTRNGETSRFQMKYSDLEKAAGRRELEMPSLEATNTVKQGTKVALRKINKYKARGIPIQSIRRGLARRFSIIGKENEFQVVVNGSPITPEERDLKRLLEKDSEGKPYLWEYDNVEVKVGTGWRVSGWIGALNRTNELEDGIQRGISLMARGKMVQEPFVFNAVVGQQYALSYLVGEIDAEFVDQQEDTIGTTRNSLVWDTEANSALKEWGQKEVNRIAREWAEKRSKDNEAELLTNPLYQKFVEEAKRIDNSRATKNADRLIRGVIKSNPLGDKSLKSTIDMCINFLEFDAFQELATELSRAGGENIDGLIELFREWEIVEAKEMMRVTEGRIKTIDKLERLIEGNALEVPTLHNFLKEFPWVLDPRWTLIADEETYSELLRKTFPDGDLPEEERRIDFLCIKETNHLVVVEIKRPRLKASKKELGQIEEYVNFMRDYTQKTTDPDLRSREVTGYLLCGDIVQTGQIRERRKNLEASQIYVRLYSDLLRMVNNNHKEFLSRYKKLREAKVKGR